MYTNKDTHTVTKFQIFTFLQITINSVLFENH
jgi:hypothetical protein